MAEKYKDKGLAVLAVDVQKGDTPDAVKAFAAQNHHKHILLVGGGSVASRYGVSATPTTFYIDPKGNIVGREMGQESLGEIEAKVKKILPSGS